MRTHLKDTDQIEKINARARYCQIVAGKLRLTPLQAARTVLAAWLTSLMDMKGSIATLVEQFDLNEILFPPQSGEERPCVESEILNLVKSYQESKKLNPELGDDVNLMRKRLAEDWAVFPGREDILKKFVRVLEDERFLAQNDKAAGRILIVDASETATGMLSLPLDRDGYEVSVVRDSVEADEALGKFQPDLIVIDMDLPVVAGLMVDGIAFCQRVKRMSETSEIPVIILSPPGKRNAKKCIHAGAEDFLTKPIDLEMFFYKVRQLIKPSGAGKAGATREGVSGTLSDMQFTDMIQIFCAGGQNMKITLTQDPLQGVVFVKEGNIIHAELADIKGEKAFFELMTWREGDFNAVQSDHFPAQTISSSTMSLLMEGARLADEGMAVGA